MRVEELGQSVPRIVPAKRPIFGDTWPDPPTEEKSTDDRRFLESLRVHPARAARKETVRQIIGDIDQAASFLDDLREWMHSVSDHSRDRAIGEAIELLNGIAEHYERELG